MGRMSDLSINQMASRLDNAELQAAFLSDTLRDVERQLRRVADELRASGAVNLPIRLHSMAEKLEEAIGPHRESTGP